MMNNSHHILPEIQKLLERYQERTIHLATAVDEQISTAHLESSFFQGLPDLDAQAMQHLLRSQALWLLKMYDAATTGSAELDSSCAHVPRRLKDLDAASHARLYAFRFDSVPAVWRKIYSDTQVLASFHVLLKCVDERAPAKQSQRFLAALDEVIVLLDRCLITAGGAGGSFNRNWLERTIKMIDQVWRPVAPNGPEGEFSPLEPDGRPALTKPCDRHQGWSILQFEQYVKSGHRLAAKTGELGPVPIVFTDLTRDSWPALQERRWFRPAHLLRETLGGRRLVPVEIGRSYVDPAWGQQLMPFKEFLVRFVDSTLTTNMWDDPVADPVAEPVADPVADPVAASEQPGYLAQHDLFQQVPSLRSDILVPDFCWADVPSTHPLTGAARRKLAAPQLNAWFGPPRTITPLHTDGYTNLLCQVVGAKYVRLYPPQADSAMRPRGANENGVDMRNTSSIDMGALLGWEQSLDSRLGDEEASRRNLEEVRKSLEGVPYFECILEPGDALLIPIGWWHYVRSLSVSFSVSFWWN